MCKAGFTLECEQNANAAFEYNANVQCRCVTEAKQTNVWRTAEPRTAECYSSLYTIRETNFFFGENMCFSETNRWTTNSLLHTICLFVNCFRQKMFHCKLTNISFEFRQKTGKTGTKRLPWKIDSPKRRITVHTLYVFCLLFVVSPLFANSV